MKKIVFILLWMPLSVLAQKVTWQLDTANSKITYAGSHPVHQWTGENSKLKGIAIQEDQEKAPKQIAILAAVKDFDSKNENRDAHALEVLNALRFPEVKFYSNQIELISEDTLQFWGTIDFHGIKVEKQLAARFNQNAQGLQLQGSFEILASDFGIRLPSFMLVRMEDAIQIEFDVQFVSQIDQ